MKPLRGSLPNWKEPRPAVLGSSVFALGIPKSVIGVPPSGFWCYRVVLEVAEAEVGQPIVRDGLVETSRQAVVVSRRTSGETRSVTGSSVAGSAQRTQQALYPTMV